MEGLPDSLCQRGRFFPSKTLARPDIKSGRRGDGGDESQDIEEGRGGDEEFAQAPEGGQDQESEQYIAQIVGLAAGAQAEADRV